MELVLKHKLSPLKANTFVLKHPVISQRLKADKLIKSKKEKVSEHVIILESVLTFMILKQ